MICLFQYYRKTREKSHENVDLQENTINHFYVTNIIFTQTCNYL